MKKIHINIPDEIHEALKERAKQNGRTMNAEVVRIFERGLSVIEVPVIGKIENGVITIQEELDRR